MTYLCCYLFKTFNSFDQPQVLLLSKSWSQWPLPSIAKPLPCVKGFYSLPHHHPPLFLHMRPPLMLMSFISITVPFISNTSEAEAMRKVKLFL